MTKPDLEALGRAAFAAFQDAMPQAAHRRDFDTLDILDRQAWMLAAGAVELLVLDHVQSRLTLQVPA